MAVGKLFLRLSESYFFMFVFAYVYYDCFCRKASLALLRKMIHYVTPALLDEICSVEGNSVNFGSQLVEVLSTVLDNEVRNIAFKMLHDVLSSIVSRILVV